MAAVPSHDRWDDERVRHVQRAGHELLAAAAGNGTRRDDAEGVREGHTREPYTVGSHPGIGKLLGAVPRAGIQAAHYPGHHALWRGSDARVRDPGGAAYP